MWLFEIATTWAFTKRKKLQSIQKVSEILGNKEIVHAEIELENARANYKEKADLNKQIENLNQILLNKEIELEERTRKSLDLIIELNELRTFISDFHIDYDDVRKDLDKQYELFKEVTASTDTININSTNIDLQSLLGFLSESTKLLFLQYGILKKDSDSPNLLALTKKGQYFMEKMNVELRNKIESDIQKF
jgi:hypothetical protein